MEARGAEIDFAADAVALASPLLDAEQREQHERQDADPLPVRRRLTARRLVWDVLSVRASKFGHWTHFIPSRVFEVFILALIVANTALVVALSVPALRGSVQFESVYVIVEAVSLAVFVLEYLLRLWACVEDERYQRPVRGRLRWMVKPLSILDLLALVPFAVDLAITSNAFRGAKAMQLLRVATFLRLERQSKAFARLRFVVRKKTNEFVITLFIAVVLLLVSSCALYYIENTAQPEAFGSVPETLWWSISTLTTIGYGDVVPITPWGKVVAGLVGCFGVVLFALPAGIVGSGFVEIFYEERLAAVAAGAVPPSAPGGARFGMIPALPPSRSGTEEALLAQSAVLVCPHCRHEISIVCTGPSAGALVR